MIALWIMAALGFGAIAYDLLDDDKDDGAGDPDTPPSPQPSGGADGSLFFVSDGEALMGSDGPDAFLPEPGETSVSNVTLQGGAGDDIFDFDTGTLLETNLSSSEIDGGSGDDQIYGNGDGATILGGDGNDTIEGSHLAGQIFGDAGDDQITISSSSGDISNVDGGTGNDTIDGRGSNNIRLFGGAGDDLILTDGFASAGAAYVIGADGGDGDDTLRHEFAIFPPRLIDPMADDDVPAALTGGDGADQFEIAFRADASVGPSSYDSSDVVERTIGASKTLPRPRTFCPSISAH